jgi:hypothetical protein
MLSRVGKQPTDDDPGRWDLSDPGYRPALLPDTPLAFEIDEVLVGPDEEEDAPIEAAAWMDDSRGMPFRCS